MKGCLPAEHCSEVSLPTSTATADMCRHRQSKSVEPQLSDLTILRNDERAQSGMSLMYWAIVSSAAEAPRMLARTTATVANDVFMLVE